MLDTNVVLSALVFGGGLAARLRTAWQAGRCTPLASRATVQELARVLGYPKLGLDPAEREELLADYLPFVGVVRMPATLPRLRVERRDADDAMFLQLAMAGRAQALVSGDGDLLALDGRMAFPILGLRTFVESLEGR